MLYVFLGHDIARAKQEVKKRSNGNVMVFGDGGNNFEEIPSRLNAPGLFSDTLTFLLDRPMETEEGKQLLEEYTKQMSDSQHTVFIVETKLDAKTKKLFPAHTVFENFDAPEQKGNVRPNVFAFTDTVLRRDKKNTWIGYQKLLRAGISAEEIHGALSWAVRSVLLATKTNSAAESGLKPFVYTKSKRVGDAVGQRHFEDLSRTLVSVYHHARAGKGELEFGLEKMLLEKI